ncbi:MAG: hydroxyisourate hydrolase [Burkholderiales bacterium]
MNNDEVTRRQFLSAGMALGAVAVVPQLAGCATAAPAAERTAAAPPAPVSGTPPQPAGARPPLPPDVPRLTLHAIDTFHGSPGAGMRIDLSRLEGGRYQLVKSFETNKGGRTDDPVLVGDALKEGRYELLLYVDEYFAKRGTQLPNPPFLGKVPIRFAVYDAKQKYHVPVLFSPWSYSYYRGS